MNIGEELRSARKDRQLLAEAKVLIKKYRGDK